MKDAYLIKLKCESCGHEYLFSDPVVVGGTLSIGHKVVTEVGCPKCLGSDSTVMDTLRFCPPLNDLLTFVPYPC